MFWEATDVRSNSGNVFATDTVDSVLPSTLLFGERLSQGDFAFRNPFQSGGAELGGMPNGGYFSPLTWPYWVFPTEVAPGVVKLLEIAAIALGMSLFLRRLKITPAAWPVASLLYASSGFMLAWTGWPQTRVAALIPLLFWATERLIATRRWTSIPLLGLVLGAMWLCGFPAIVFYSLYLITAYAVIRAFTLWRGNTQAGWLDILWQALRYAGGILSGVLVAAVHLLPFVLASNDLIDFEGRGGNKGVHINTSALSTTLFPYLFGRPDFTHYWGTGHPIEMLSYFGIGGIALVVIALVLRRRLPVPNPIMWFFVGAVALIGAGMYWGGPALALIQELPTLSSSLSGRLRSVLGFLLAVLAAFGLHAILRPKPQVLGTKWGRRALDLAGLALAIAIVIALVMTSTNAILNSPTPPLVERWLQFTLLAVAVFVGITTALSKYPHWLFKVTAGLAIYAMVALPAAQVARQWWTVNDADTFYPQTQATDYLAENLDDQRFISFGNSIYIGVSSVYELRDFAGRGFTTSEWRDLIATAVPGAQRTITYAQPPVEAIPEASSNNILDRYGVHYATMPSSDQLPGPVEEVTGRVETTLVLSDDSSIATAEVTGPSRGVILSAAGVTDLPWDGMKVEVKAVDSDGNVLTTNEQELRQVDDSIFLALDADEFDADLEWTVEVSTTTPDATINFWSEDGDASLQVVRPQDDDLNVVDTGDVTIVERDTALERIRWASDSTVIEDREERLEYLDTEATPDEVVLEDAADEQPGGGEGSVVVTDSGDLDITTATVTTDGPGWVIFADSMRRDGWTVTLNGEEAELVDAEHAGAAVYVPAAGVYELKLEFVTPGFFPGLVVTGVTLLGFVGVGVWALVAQRRRREADATVEARNVETSEA
ncbi:YfhO family protein [Gulosibacter sp. ACHW.36C]|uniref:YfhO family protein n=1 Tax=Gulosibacter sediminis TaxID=1729695 RepID=A0ABY4MVE6_9MICO|nr:YfhO family protein [Gulosibacter sediminis]UQN14405.1 YfhO family protein [Gulosibacter sediminis]